MPKSPLDREPALARSAGPIETGSYRVVVHEADSRVTFKDFEDLEQARRYANDAASETEDGIVYAYVVDDSLRVVATGEHY